MVKHTCQYTRDYPGGMAAKDWRRHLIGEAGRFWNQTVLEIGVYEGRSAAWLLEHVLPLTDTHYIGIDPWGTTDEGQPRRWQRIEQRCRRNLAPHAQKVDLFKGHAEDLLPGLDRTVHLAYIDAAKDTESVILYSTLVWPMVAPGGLIIWSEYRHPKHQTVMRAVDSLSSGWEYETVWCHDQLCVRKL